MRKRRSGFTVAFKLIGLIKPLLGVMVIAVLMGVLGYLCATFITVFGGYALLDVIGFDTPVSIQLVFVSVVVFAVLRGVLRYAEQASNHYIAFKLLALIRDKVFRSLRRLSPAKLETRDKGDLISLITTDIELLEVFYAHTVSPVMIAVLFSVFMVLFIGSYHVGLAIIALCGYLIVGILIPLTTSKFAGASGAEYREKSGELSSYTLQSVRGLREVLQYGAGEQRLYGIEKRTKKLGSLHKRLKQFEGIGTVLTNGAILVCSFAVLFAGVYLYSSGKMGFGGLLITFIGTMSSFGPVVALSNLANNLVHTFAAGNRVLDILEEEPVVLEVVGAKDISFEGLRCREVDFSYGGEEVLKDYSIDIKKRETIGIVGRSGTGKSTLLRLMMRFWDVDDGKVELSGENIKNVNTKSLRELQGFVTQETILFQDTLFDNVRIGKWDATREEVEAACKKASIHEFILSLPDGYNTKVGELGETLSGGERQRIGLARAFLHDAPMMLLDEPTSNLDSLNEGLILRSLSEESEEKTVVLVSHRLSTLSIADRVVKMESARES